MEPPKRLLFNAFSMNCVSHLQHGLWGRPDTRQREYHSLEPWLELARILERGGFDALFLADVTGVYDNYQGAADAAFRQGMQVPVNDPALLIPAMASVTEHLGFAFTSSVLGDHPYLFARRLSTLDHLTRGRVAWNIVTSYLPGAARNLGYPELPAHDDRYDRGDDYLDVVYKLLEASWADDAVVADAERGVYAEPDRIRTIDHVGPYYQVPGPHLSEPSPQRTPVLFQAGASKRGREFAARHAECIFTIGNKRSLPRIVDDIRQRTVRHGRRPDDLRFFVAVAPVVGGTEAEARAKEAELMAQVSVEGGLVHLSGSTGADLGTIDPDRPLADFASNAVAGVIANMIEAEPDRTLTFADLARRQMTGTFITGSPEQVADRLQGLADAGADGFNLIYTSTPGTFVDFIEGVVPVLRERGLMQDEYGPGTLREKLFGAGALLPDHHPGGRLRHEF
ncbi:MAG: NtaA/DmoA family FMN-dependent monooxygenase [Actinomycetota bacterium]